MTGPMNAGAPAAPTRNIHVAGNLLQVEALVGRRQPTSHASTWKAKCVARNAGRGTGREADAGDGRSTRRRPAATEQGRGPRRRTGPRQAHDMTIEGGTFTSIAEPRTGSTDAA